MSEDIQNFFKKLKKSKFRSGIKLKPADMEYFNKKGMDTILQHGLDFVNRRLAPSNPPNDGRQTPWGKHPVFVAQHATATCCRGCLEKWHNIPKGRKLSQKEVDYVLQIIEHWLKIETGKLMN